MWFAPPPTLPTRVLTRLPDRFRRMARTPWSDANRAGHPADCFLEGPCFDAAGRLLVVDIPFGRIFRIADGQWSLVGEYDGWPNGMKVLPDGQLLVADYKNGLVRIDPVTGAVTPHLSTVVSEGFKGLNDLALAEGGVVLFTDQGQTGLQDPAGRVYRLHPDGRLDRLIANGPSPNGLALNRAGTHLHVAMTRSAQIWRFLLRPDSIVAKAQCFAQLPGGTTGPDGLAVDAQDRLFVCDPGHGCVWVLDAHGQPCYRIASCAGRMLTNCAFAPDGRTLAITDSDTGTILACDVPPS